MTEKPDIIALVTARMSHDLTSPIGAIGNGVELVEFRGKSLSEEGELVKASLKAIVAKLKLFRIAFGQFNAEEMLNATKISAVQTAWNITGRIHVNFAPGKNAEDRYENLSFNIAIYSGRHAAGGKSDDCNCRGPHDHQYN